MTCCGEGSLQVARRLSIRSIKWKLDPHPILNRGVPLLVCILDGWGENRQDDYNAIFKANIPTISGLKAFAPKKWRTIKAHGTSVGLPTDDDMGNSEVGHNAMGAGKIIEQGAGLVDTALRTGKIYKDAGFAYIQEAWKSGGTQHFIGLVSDGGVHSRYDQLAKLMKGCVERGCKKIRVHGLTDGRDCADGSSTKHFGELENDLQVFSKKGCDAKIASGGGRMYVTMDRYEADWSIVERGWQAHVLGEAPYKFESAVEALKSIKEEDPSTNDQYLPPFVIVGKNRKPVGTIQDGDAVVIFNYRADRVVQLSKAFEYDDFRKFDRKRHPKVRFVGMMQYDGDLKLPHNYLVAPPLIERTSGQYLAKNGIKTFACRGHVAQRHPALQAKPNEFTSLDNAPPSSSETQKFGHVTFFWNGNRSGKLDKNLETYHEIVSDTCPFNEKPKMKAAQIAQATKDAIQSRKYDLIRVNLANGDMVGHTGDFQAVLTACDAVDKSVKVMIDAIVKVGGIYLITSDHGNADDMAQRKKDGQPIKDKDGNIVPLTSHTLAPVPIAIGGPGLSSRASLRTDLPNAGLSNVTATFINLLGFEAPSDYEPTLIKID